MTVAVIADCHIAGPGGSPEPLLEQLEELDGESCRRLVLLGDLFQVWVAGRQYETAEIRGVVDALVRLRGRGVRLDYIEGNRDFFLRGSPYEECFDSVGDELAFRVGERRYLAVHGDGLDADDRAYRFWRWLSKNRLSRACALALPAGMTRRFIHGTERRLARTNFKHKIRIPEEVILAYAERRLAEGHDVLLLGHFHDPRHWRIANGEVRLLEAWFHSRKIHWLESV